MEVAFYYHYPIYEKDGKIYSPGFIACFIESLAKRVDELVLIAHTIQENKRQLYDYQLTSNNITLLRLGERKPAWYRHLFHRSILKTVGGAIQHCDYLLVRSPTPLAPFFHKVLRNNSKTKLRFLIVGDYEESIQQKKIKGIRDWIMKQYVLWNDHLFKKEIRRTPVLVNSPALFQKYQPIAKHISMVKTTTLSQADFFYREEEALPDKIRLLYTGRMDKAKGLLELLHAFIILVKELPQLELHLVGWEENDEKPIEKQMHTIARKDGVEAKVFFHGKKKIGSELNSMYRMCQVYVIPSYHEGFPRTIWEAMANGLPVIATRVGAIPDYLSHKKNAILIEPKQMAQLTDAIRLITQDHALRNNIVHNAYQLAKENTLEIQTPMLLQQLLHE